MVADDVTSSVTSGSSPLDSGDEWKHWRVADPDDSAEDGRVGE